MTENEILKGHTTYAAELLSERVRLEGNYRVSINGKIRIENGRLRIDPMDIHVDYGTDKEMSEDLQRHLREILTHAILNS